MKQSAIFQLCKIQIELYENNYVGDLYSQIKGTTMTWNELLLNHPNVKIFAKNNGKFEIRNIRDKKQLFILLSSGRSILFNFSFLLTDFFES